MRTKGLDKKEILSKLEQAYAKNTHYADGKILRSMCTTPDSIARKAWSLFYESNLGDPGLFPGTAQLEREAIRSLQALLHAPEKSKGYIVSGGTEANLLAMYAARNNARVDHPQIIVPESAHVSFDKISDMLNLKLVKARLDEQLRVDLAFVEDHINEHTVAIVGNAGTAESGSIDPIDALSKIAKKYGIPLHVDAAFGGLLIPFLKELGYPVQEFDFALEGVQSITVDPHKMGLSLIPAGGILVRDFDLLKRIQTPTPYVTDECQCTILGTRPGASAAATWAVFESLGQEGFKKIVKKCMDMTTFLYEGLEEAGFEVLLRPPMNVLLFRSPKGKMFVDKLQEQGWYVSYVSRLDCIRVVLMPHSSTKHIVDFLNCLREQVES